MVSVIIEECRILSYGILASHSQILKYKTLSLIDEAYNIHDCGYDGGDCCPVEKSVLLGDGECHGGIYMSRACKYDGGDCELFRSQYPRCEVDTPVPRDKIIVFGDGICDGGGYIKPECDYESGDCLQCAQKVPNPALVGDGRCHGGQYNTIECGYDGTDCLQYNLKYPDCNVPEPWKIGNGNCDGGIYYNQECGFDGGDCEQCALLGADMNKVGNGFCDGYLYMNDACGNDGGDCINCVVKNPSLIGDGKCQGNGRYNTLECGYDGGDCEPPEEGRNGEENNKLVTSTSQTFLPSAQPTSNPSLNASNKLSLDPSPSPSSLTSLAPTGKKESILCSTFSSQGNKVCAENASCQWRKGQCMDIADVEEEVSAAPSTSNPLPPTTIMSCSSFSSLGNKACTAIAGCQWRGQCMDITDVEEESSAAPSTSNLTPPTTINNDKVETSAAPSASNPQPPTTTVSCSSFSSLGNKVCTANAGCQWRKGQCMDITQRTTVDTSSAAPSTSNPQPPTTTVSCSSFSSLGNKDCESNKSCIWRKGQCMDNIDG